MIKDDYILRIVEQITEAIARASGLRVQGENARASTELEVGYDLLSMPRQLAVGADPATIIQLLGDPGRIASMAELFREESRLCDALGDDSGSIRHRRRALKLLQALKAKGEQVDEKTLSSLRADLAQ